MITYPDRSNLELVRNVNSSHLRLESESLGGFTGTLQSLKLSKAAKLTVRTLLMVLRIPHQSLSGEHF